MTTISVSEAKNRLSEIVKDTAETTRQVVISVNGRKEAVLISVDEYESLMETIEILRDQQLVKKIFASMEDIQRGDVENFDDFREE